MSDLWHYTCDHGHLALGMHGMVKPGTMINPKSALPWTSTFGWFTDLEHPMADALGLTSKILRCDRTQHRYRVLVQDNVHPWVTIARHLPHRVRESLESQPGSKPMHWFVSQHPVPVEYLPWNPE